MDAGSRCIELSCFAQAGERVAVGWEYVSTPAREVADPGGLAGLEFQPAMAPSTVAGELRARGRLDREEPPPLDSSDYWYRVRFDAKAWPDVDTSAPSKRLLVFDGLATLANVWFNGTLVVESENMFRRSAADVSELVREENELVIRFAALAPAMRTKKGPRRWPTRLVKERNLRFFRTTLLGRMSGWTPPWPAVGPFRPVRLTTASACLLHELRCRPSVDEGGPKVAIDVDLTPVVDGETRVVLDVAGHREPIQLRPTQDGRLVGKATVRVPNVERWWPHTHGAQPLYPTQLLVEIVPQQGDSIQETFAVGKLGFRSVELLPSSDFGFKINGVEVFCRGACWTPLDVVTLDATRPQLREALLQAKAAGMNMLRLSGTMTYEQAVFHELCDELGILVWQDFMFANMDYPRGDERFDAEVVVEAEQVLERLGSRCSTALFCGGSETEQQAAMMGMPSDQWEHPVWRETLLQLVDARCPSVPYWYSSPGGAGMPFWPHDGCTHYYGVGAYLRPLLDARIAGVRFASECLAFAAPPAPEGAFVSSSAAPLGRVPQDNGASWTFGDVTDHYVGHFFGVNVAELKRSDPSRYLDLARRAVARAIFGTQGYFRDPEHPCRGSLIWLLRDLEPGSGWGLIDCEGKPKSGYYALRDVWAPRAAWLVDEGLSGLTVVVANDTSQPFEGELEVSLHASGGNVTERWSTVASVSAHSALRIRVEELAGRFLDSSYSYRFGPPPFHELRMAFRCGGETVSSETWQVG